MTARQFLQLGEDPDGIRLELVDGEVSLSPSPQPDHSYTDRALTIILGQYIQSNDLVPSSAMSTRSSIHLTSGAPT